MAERVPQSLRHLDAAFRESSLSYLRESQTYLSFLKGRVADKAIVDRYGDQEQQNNDLEFDPGTPTDVNKIMKDIDDVHKQISIYTEKLRGKENVTFRDSGVSLCSDRNSFANTDDFTMTAIQNVESPDTLACLTQHGEAIRRSRSESGRAPRQVVDETEMTEEERH